jgi:hypothetical protein
MERTTQSGRKREVANNSEHFGGISSCLTSAIVVGAWLTPEKRARTEMEVCVIKQTREHEEPLNITTADLVRTLKANAFMLVGDGEGFRVLPRP